LTVPDVIRQLVQRFEDNRAAYRSGEYNETQLRRVFLDPFFEALGWDVFNKQSYAEAYKDVIHEDAIKVGGATKAPDYAFRIGGTRKFFVEAKKPTVNVKEDISPAYQLRRYAWSAKLPLSILTDFEEFAVYDCRSKPDKSDKASTGRVMYFSYKDYIEKWDEITAVFSREAVLKGSFDKYAETAKGKHGTAEVDDAFLAEIERWRDLLARNIALRNPHLSQRELNYAVQMTIDRIIFLRICEDRGIEFYGQLQALLNGNDVYARLCQLFRKADERYNSGLFHFRQEKGQADSPDMLTLGLTIDDKPLKDILSGVYYPDSPYEFAVLPADILGQVYEQFLGKVIRLTSGHRAVVEDKPEVKKAGGVFYTPTYIVEYIVKNTVGAMLDGKKPGDKGVGKGKPLRVLDPACGSGSFLLGAYQYLLDWYRDGHIADGPEKWAKGRHPTLYKGNGGEWKLTTAERKRILLGHIYGVDIDPQAVEVTKLSLLLKVLEGESEETLGQQLRLFQERALPNLDRNIRCGNSLIGPDYFSSQLLPDSDELGRVNPFDWAMEFPEAMQAGRFDCVIGNPPWGADLSMDEKRYLIYKFAEVHMRTPDTFNFFLAHAYKIGSPQCVIGVIVPNNLLFQHEYAKARKFYVSDAWLISAINLGDGVFDVTAPSCIVILGKTPPRTGEKKTRVADLRVVDRSYLSVRLPATEMIDVDSKAILGSPDCIIPMNQEASGLVTKILQNVPSLLGDICDEVAAGIGTGGDKAFRIEDKFAKSLGLERDILHPALIGREMNAYYVPSKTGHSIIYSTKLISSKTHPKTLEYLKQFQSKLSQKRETKKGLIPWWSLHWPRYPKLFDAPKIVLRQTANSLFASIDDVGYYCLNSVIIVRPKQPQFMKYYVGLLNSRFVRWIYSNLTQEQNRTFAEVKPINLRKLPVRPINFTDPADVQRHDRMVALVDRMLTLHKQLAAAKMPTDTTMLQRQIEATDREIDKLVYELYGLTPEEIKIVEGG